MRRVRPTWMAEGFVGFVIRPPPSAVPSFRTRPTKIDILVGRRSESRRSRDEKPDILAPAIFTHQTLCSHHPAEYIPNRENIGLARNTPVMTN
jgi:hypothetical protein